MIKPINAIYGMAVTSHNLLQQEPQYIDTDSIETNECFSNILLHFQIRNAINKLPVALLAEYCDIMNIEIIISNGETTYQNQAG